MRVLIVKMSALGDVVHALPVLDYLHRTVQGIEIDWVVEESFAPLLTGNPLVASLHLVRFKAWRRMPLSTVTWREINQLRMQLSERAYDIVFDLQGNSKSGIITWLTGSPRRYGFDRDGVREALNVYCTTNQIPLRRQDHHITDRSLRLVSVPFGKDYGGLALTADIYTSAEDDAAAELFLATLSDGLVFLIHYGTTWKTKLWHAAGWIELGRHLLHRFPEATILLSWGGEAEQAIAQQIAAGIGGQARLLPQLSLKGFAAMLKKVDLVLGGDTGPIHMAATVGTPTVSLFRATDGRRNGPRGESHRLVQAPLPCTCCLKKECDQDQSCRQSITAEMVLEQCLDLLSGGNPQ
jgi:heptosyltransferase-1